MERFLPEIQEILRMTMMAIIILISSSVISAQPMWYSKLRQIKLMVNARQEVEKLLNFPRVADTYEWDGRKVVEYKIKEGELTIVYSRGKCSETNKNGYDVEKNIVIDIDFDLKKEINISRLDLNLEKYEKKEISDLVGVFNYTNKDLGEYYIGTSNTIKNIRFFPSKEQEGLSCKKYK